MQVRRLLRFPPERPGGKALRSFHFLTQDHTQQASFSWHSDKEDLNRMGVKARHLEEMITVIVRLSGGADASGMRVWGCHPFLFAGQGSACAFLGAALHESLPRRMKCPASVPERKVALFFC